MMTDRTDPAPDTARGPWTQPRFVLAAVVVALIAALAFVLTLTDPSDDNSPGGAAAPAPVETGPSPTPTETPGADEGSICGLPAGDQTVPTSPPAGTEWELVGTMATPTEMTRTGPGDVTDTGLRTCFAHTPLGALYAAANVLATSTDPGLRQELVLELTAAGPARDAAIEGLATEGEQTASDTRIQVAGFTFLNYSEDSTTIDLALRVSNGAYAHVPMNLTWEGGDWKAVLAPTGQLGAGLGQIPDMTGYIPWAGA